MPAPTNANYEAEYVRTLFDEFAPNYHLSGRFSFGLDDTIRRMAVAELQGKPIAICDMMSGSGQNWKFINSGLQPVPNIDQPVVLAIDPLNPHTMYAGTTLLGIYKSPNVEKE